MYKEQFDNRHKLGLERLTGDNGGRVFANERQETVETEDGTTKTVWAYDVYEVSDARNPYAAKDAVIRENYPAGDEQKVVRKAITKILCHFGIYDAADFEQFKTYNELCEAVDTNAIRGTVVAPDPTDDELLEDAQAKKVDDISAYDSSANVNAFTIGGNPMWLSFEERTRLRQSIEAAKAAGEESMTRYFAGYPFTYPVTTWDAMLYAVENYAGACTNVTEQHKQAVYALTTVGEVESYDYTVGYPEKLAF